MKSRAQAAKFFVATVAAVAVCFVLICLSNAQTPQAPAGAPKAIDAKGAAEAKAENAAIGLDNKVDASSHTMDPQAQWFPDAGFGLFIHWGLASVRASNISWPMIPGRPLNARKDQLTEAERERVIREADYNLNGKKPEITPNEYWSVAPQFNPQQFDPDKWCKAAKAAGFEYAVLTAKHHEGFALWPSAYGDFNTKNYMGGRDLVKEYVEACRRNGLKVGLYFSGPDWHFDRDYMTFLYRGNQNSWMPSLGPDLEQRTTKKSPEEIAQHQKEFAALVKGQIEELCTNYGPIDLLWFDGKPNLPNASSVISIERIRQLQPHIVVNPRLHGKGDYITYERTLNTDEVAKTWAEFCNTWTSSWSHQEVPFRSDAFVLGQLAKCRSLGVNYLLGVGPTKDGVFCDDIYKNMAVVAEWMNHNSPSVKGTKPLPPTEKATAAGKTVPATASKTARFLFAVPEFNGGMMDSNMVAPGEVKFELKGVAKPAAVKLLGDGSMLAFDYAGDTLSVTLPADKRTKLVDVVQVDLK